MNPLRLALRSVVPFGARVALMRLRRSRAWKREEPEFELATEDASRFPHMLAEHSSSLRRPGTTYGEDMQRGKEANVALAASFIDGKVIPPGGVFSYHHLVGPPTRKRGFVMGAELQDSELKPGIGGGCCQVSNLLYVLALLSGASIVERHRHGLDLFPDSGRKVPFGCGATVFFNSHDLRFRNELSQQIRVSVTIENGNLIGRTHTKQPVEDRYELFEMESSLRRDGASWIRENRVGRRKLTGGGIVVAEEEVAHNVARCLYDPEQ